MLDSIKELLLQRLHFGKLSDHIQVDCPIGFTGEIKLWPVATIPNGFYLCDGSSKSVIDNYALFSIIGYTYGGSGANFNLPNFKGYAPMGYDSTQTEFNALGKTGGAKTAVADLPLHHHDNAVPGGSGAYSKYILQQLSGTTAWHWDSGGNGAAGSGTSDTGNTGNHNNLQPYLTINFIIKY